MKNQKKHHILYSPAELVEEVKLQLTLLMNWDFLSKT